MEKRVREPSIKLCPLMGYETHAIRDEGILLRVAYAETDEQVLSGRAQYLPLAMKVAMARILGQALLDAATAADMGQAPTRTPQ